MKVEDEYATLCATMHILRDRNPFLFKDACIHFLSLHNIYAFDNGHYIEQACDRHKEISKLYGQPYFDVRHIPARYPIYPER